MVALCCLRFSLSSRFRFELLDLRSTPGDEGSDKNYGDR